ncbi:MAG: hypothetical protein AAF628_00430 [Planctomycetota bacterium]
MRPRRAPVLLVVLAVWGLLLGGAWAQEPLECPEPGGRLVAVGSQVTRIQGERRVELGCTEPGGPGAIRALAPHPDGTTYIAAQRGLFAVSPEVDVLDAVDLRDGVPPGAPVGAHVDGRGKLWLLTDGAFGCVDTDFYFGRTFGVADGVGPGPYRALRLGRDGALELRDGSQPVVYRPGRLPKPRLQVRGVAGQPYRPEVALAVAGDLPIEAACDDGATLRWRRVGHHLWQPLEVPPVVPAFPPGEHRFELIALDRELQASDPVPVVIRVAYPFYYQKQVLLGIAGGVAVVLLGGFLVAGRGGGWGAVLRAIASAGLAMVVLLQVAAGLAGHGRSWPFVGYSMYTERYGEGSLVYKTVLIGIWPDGSRREITPGRAGLTMDDPFQRIAPLIHGGDAERREFLGLCNRAQPHDPLRGFLVASKRYRLTDQGPVAVYPVILARYEES